MRAGTGRAAANSRVSYVTRRIGNRALIGSVIDKYEVLQKLGEGATATVYRGRHMAIGNDVAIKVLHPHLSASSRYRERFNREARAVGRLSHQNIVSILDYSGQGAGDCYIVTELVDGTTLLGLLQEHGTLPSEIAAVIGMELCAALGFAHRAQVIHRDIKPENVMIRRDGKVKLMDFGVARVLDEGSITLDGSLLGSPAYMSPQQAQDQPLDGRSDLFSLGTVLFHSVTGHVPFSGGNASVILKNIIDGNRAEVLELAPAVSPAFAAVVERLLQPRPEDRFATAEDARTALLATLAEVEMSPDHAALQVANYLTNPEGCAAAIRAHLEPVLIRKGKERLLAGDHLGALQLFNRLLALDENNAEVLELIQGLHQAPAPEPSPRRWLALLACSMGLVGALGVWWLRAAAVQVPPAAAALDVAVPAAQLPLGPPSPGLEVTPVLPTAKMVSEVPGGPRTPARPGRTLALPLAPARLNEPQDSSLTPVTDASTLSGTATELPTTASLVVVSGVPADVWLDDKAVGRTFGGPPDTWVATRKAPLSVSVGHHKLVLKNRSTDDWVVEFDARPGEIVVQTGELKRKPVTVLINFQVPKDCTYTVGGVPYGTVGKLGTFDLSEPDPGTPIVFTCGDKTMKSAIPKRFGGETVVVPASVDPWVNP